MQAKLETDLAGKTRLLDDAERRLDQAAELDVRSTPDGAVRSSSGAIPLVVGRQRKVIDAMRAEPPLMAPDRNDVQLTFGLGTNYDTNVVLLGWRTDLPRGVSDEKDFGLALTTTIDYTLDLSKLDPDLRRWALGLRGRLGELWHADIDEFDEQNYGGSIALQYEALSRTSGGDFGPLYLRLQYDFDYTFLGRSDFLRSNSVRPSVRVHWLGDRALSDFYAKYEVRRYFEPLYDSRFERSGTYPAIGMFQSFEVLDLTPTYERLGWPAWGLASDASFVQQDPDHPARYLSLFGGFEYSWGATDGQEFDTKRYSVLGGVSWPLPWGVDFDTLLQFEWEEYQNGSLVDFHRRGRRDLIQRYEARLSRTFVLREGQEMNRYTPHMDRLLMTVQAHATWTIDDGNVVDRLGQAVFSYDRAVYWISFAFVLN